MGLLDILNGMQNGPRGSSDPNKSDGGGMSPITMAILALLAYKAIKHMGGSQASATPGTNPSVPDSNMADGSSGGLGDLLKGGLGGLLAGGAAGGILSGGLSDLLEQFRQNGHGEAADSWIGTGPNKEIAVNDLAKSIGVEDIAALSEQTGLSSEQLLSSFREELPSLIDQLTPDGRLPTEQELSRLI